LPNPLCSEWALAADLLLEPHAARPGGTEGPTRTAEAFGGDMPNDCGRNSTQARLRALDGASLLSYVRIEPRDRSAYVRRYALARHHSSIRAPCQRNATPAVGPRISPLAQRFWRHPDSSWQGHRRRTAGVRTAGEGQPSWHSPAGGRIVPCH